MKIIVDTREQQFWTFSSYDVDTEHIKLNAGDYSIEGLTDIFTIDRKKSVSEIAGNIVQKRFWREMELMKGMRYKFILCEFSLSDINGYPANLDLPKSIRDKIKVKPAFIRKKLHEMHDTYGVGILLCGDRYNAERIALHIMKRVYERYSR